MKPKKSFPNILLKSNKSLKFYAVKLLLFIVCIYVFTSLQVHTKILFILATTVISEPDDVTVCEGRGAVFTCVLNSNIRSDDVQWYRFIKDNSTTVMVDPDGDNINFITNTNENTTSSSLTITNTLISFTGFFWVVTPSLDVCNASLSVLAGNYVCINV